MAEQQYDTTRYEPKPIPLGGGNGQVKIMYLDKQTGKYVDEATVFASNSTTSGGTAPAGTAGATGTELTFTPILEAGVETGDYTGSDGKTYTEVQKVLYEAKIVASQYSKGIVKNTDGTYTDKATNKVITIDGETPTNNTRFESYLKAQQGKVHVETITDPLSINDPKIAAALGITKSQFGQATEAAMATARAELLAFAENNGFKFPDTELETLAKDIANQTKTKDEVEQLYRNTYLATKYKAWENEIKQGYNVKQLAAPYMDSMANLLEIPLQSITVNDPLIQEALGQVDESGKASYMPTWQFERKLRSDDRYYQTNKSHNEMANFAVSLAKTFGLA